MKMEPKPLPFTSLTGISDKTMSIHHDKLYVGYVNKANEISEKLMAMHTSGVGLDAANQTYSELRALRDGETFAVNAIYLHEYYFDTLGGKGEPSGPLVDALVETYGSIEKFIAFFSATGMAVRGWVVLCWDTQAKQLKMYGCDSHNQGGIWGCMPILVLDVYEHAYFIDYGSDRKTYIQDWWKNLHWEKANEIYVQLTSHV
ncbi:superoxide dismutase [Candidatus Uhrbacteria bacterium]|nr:superoxide dismutase [Candidatus Uhrbacteria bacterium]